MSTDRSSRQDDERVVARLAISVIIPHYRQPELLRDCLSSLARQTLPSDRYEVIVIDNDSPCDLRSLKDAYPQVRFLTETQRGAAHARNRGMKAARGRNFAFIDADCVASPGWLAAGLSALQQSDLVGGAVNVTFSDPKNPMPVETFEKIFAFRQQRYIECKHFAVTANLFAIAAVAEAIGPFKNRVAEDMDWCHRARALGFRLAFNDRSIISHPARRTWAELAAKWDRLIRERWNGFGGRTPMRQFRWALLAIATALSSAPHLAVIVFSRRGEGLGARAGAAWVLIRIRLWRARRMLAVMGRCEKNPPLTDAVEA